MKKPCEKKAQIRNLGLNGMNFWNFRLFKPIGGPKPGADFFHCDLKLKKNLQRKMGQWRVISFKISGIDVNVLP